jgi:signal-transduction protein with cAMP-binding, CBS, and nucleotidyltransferase domain
MYSTSRDQRVRDLVDKEIMTIDESALVSDSVRIMKNKGLSSIFVTSSGDKNAHTLNFPIGILTERDILYRVIAENKSPYKTMVKEVMSSPVISIDEGATVRDTITLMREKNIRRLIVSRQAKTQDDEKDERGDSSPIGIVTLMSIVGNVPTESLALAEIESPSPGKTVETVVNITCPYCESKFQDKKELSKHIDRIHVGSGLLEGDTRRW